MLDLNHPMSKHIFRASGLLDGLLMAGQRMSVSPSPDRAELLGKCLSRLDELRELALAQFPSRAVFIVAAVDELEAGLRALAGLGGGQIIEDRRNGSGDCSVCGTTITHYPKYGLVLCGKCDELFIPAHGKLCGFDGFGTDAI
ncbi:hypothetical protein [Zavarzinella formosa]|uniref:hypothetical protein n=1 Tax=Zavarzinella formosa TaxID=360055 RepID=UPI00031A3D95|nr:hypothetical protein [Zavarzinella formosa]